MRSKTTVGSSHHPRLLSPGRRQVVDEVVRLVTPTYPALDPADRARVHASVCGFVSSQIESLPSFMFLPYQAAMTAFELLPVLRFRRRFPALDEARKRAYLALWSDAAFGPARDFVKLMRSCALLAYFDHPDVLRRLPGAGATVGNDG